MTAAVSTPGARALYLGAGKVRRVSCTDEALVVSTVLGQIQRFPISRVARVVCSAGIDWAGGALALCFSRGIGITWRDGRGSALACGYPVHAHAAAFQSALEVMLEGRQGLSLYDAWLHARRYAVLRHWGQSLQRAILPVEWEGLKREWVYLGQHPEHLPLPLRALCLAYVASRLAFHKVEPRQYGLGQIVLALDEDLCALLWGEMNLSSGALAQKADADLGLTTLFERWLGANGAALDLHINALWRASQRAMVQ